jgi:hypothetical protein
MAADYGSVAKVEVNAPPASLETAHIPLPSGEFLVKVFALFA